MPAPFSRAIYGYKDPRHWLSSMPPPLGHSRGEDLNLVLEESGVVVGQEVTIALFEVSFIGQRSGRGSLGKPTRPGLGRWKKEGTGAWRVWGEGCRGQKRTGCSLNKWQILIGENVFIRTSRFIQNASSNGMWPECRR